MKSFKQYLNNSKFFYIIFTILTIYLILPTRFASFYDCIKSEEILKNLLAKTTKNITLLNQNKKCSYRYLIKDNEYFYKKPFIDEIIDKDEIMIGGEYYPNDCSPLFSTAIIIEYRNRPSQLKQFLTYMHNFLRKQKIHYRIFVIEQNGNKLFNRAKLFNIGAKIAMSYDFPCLILHDVDLMPMTLGNIYACTKRPRHMCSSIDIFRFNLPYRTIFGGANAMDAETFKFINGFSNLFEGWGGEDDDLYERLNGNGIEICRFEPSHSFYSMLRHKKENPSPLRLELLTNGPKRFLTDGLNSLKYVQRKFTLNNTFTHVLVDL